MDTYRYVIIGNSAGGLAAAREIRRCDSSGPLLLLSDEPYPAYSRPLIAKHISSGMQIDDMLLAPRSFYQQQGMELRLATRVVSVDYDAHTLKLDDGAEASWSRLLLATGGTPITPDIEGIDRQGVHTFTTFNDAEAIARRLPAVRHAVVIGGGFIGLSAADALRRRGVAVTIVELQPRLLAAMLDSAASRIVEQATASAGVRVATSRRVVCINGDHPLARDVSSVTLDDGTRIQCEMVVLAVGVRPRAELAAGSLALDRGILVDDSMRTSRPDVFACGDACQSHDFVRGGSTVQAIWPNATTGGAVAGATMAGFPRQHQGGTTLNALPYFGLSTASAGIVEHDPDTQEAVAVSSRGHYRKVVLQDGFVVGMVFVGDTSKFGLLYQLMKRRVNVAPIKETLVSDGFGLLTLPEELWRAGVAVHG